MRVTAYISPIGFAALVLASEMVRAFLLLVMLLVGFAGLVRFLLKAPLGRRLSQILRFTFAYLRVLRGQLLFTAKDAKVRKGKHHLQ